MIGRIEGWIFDGRDLPSLVIVNDEGRTFELEGARIVSCELTVPEDASIVVTPWPITFESPFGSEDPSGLR